MLPVPAGHNRIEEIIDEELRSWNEEMELGEEFEDGEKVSSLEGVDISLDPNDPSQVWFRAEENGNTELCSVVAKALMEEFHIDKWGMSWAYTCSKPRPNEFGGGAFMIKKDQETKWIDTLNWMQENE